MADNTSNNNGIPEKDQREIAAFFEKFDRIGDKLERNAESAPAPASEESAEEYVAPSRLARRAKGQPRATGVRVSEKNPGADDEISDVLAVAHASAPVLLASAGAGASYAWQDSGNDDAGGGAKKNPKGKSKKKKKKHRIHWFRLIFLIFLLGVIICGLAAWMYVKPIMDSTPRIDPDEISTMLTESSTLYDDEGNIIDDIYMGDGRRTNVLYEAMPENLTDAFIAIEDKTFWTHHGFNFVRIVGAVRDSVMRGNGLGGIQGTSTITQQLARNLWLPDDKSKRTIVRKLQEAFIAIQVEESLTKEQIIEAYLNTVSLGNRSYGVQAAAQSYFSKDVQELSLLECAALASLAQLPGKNAFVQTFEREDVSADDEDLLFMGDQYAYVYNDTGVGRVAMILRFMLEQELITQEEYDEAAAQDLRDLINPHFDADSGIANYFADYAIQQAVTDIMAQYDISEDEARQKLYTGGLRVYTTMNARMQNLIETEFIPNENFPRLITRKDKAGNILDKNNKILLYSYDNFFNEEGIFTLSPDEYEALPDGGLKLLAGKRLNFYTTQVRGNTDYSVEFKDLYVQDDRIYSIIRGGVIRIASEYKSKDEDDNLIISGEFFKGDNGFNFVDGGIALGPDSFTIRQAVVQPQSAMVVLDYHTGAIKAMIGGRNTEGRLLYNRADSPRQPGSSIKPMSVYGPALQMGADGEPVIDGEMTYGTYWTAASGIMDEPMQFQDRTWPKNWYNSFRGMQSLRKSVEQSVNVNAVKVQLNIGAERSLKFLKNLGVTSVVETGETNDMNPAAMALGGMTRGISPLQMAAGYGAFGNGGLYVEPRPYTKITNRRGEVIIGREPYTKQAMDPGVAFIITDILRGVVTNGIANRAAISSQPVAGKTGTTTEKYDAWFVGFTPQYSAALWIGCDVGIELSEGSGAATRAWSKIMTQVCEGLERGSFQSAPANVTTATVDAVSGMLPSEYSSKRSEFFIRGTAPTLVDNYSGPVYICPISGYLATPYCPARVPFGTAVASEDIVGGNEDNPDETASQGTAARPKYYCHLHNGDPEHYPIDPAQTLNEDFYWDGVVRDNAYYESLQEELDGTDDPTQMPDGTRTNPPWDPEGLGLDPFGNPISTPQEQQQAPTQEQGQAPPEQPPPTESPPEQTPPPEQTQQGQGAQGVP